MIEPPANGQGASSEETHPAEKEVTTTKGQP